MKLLKLAFSAGAFCSLALSSAMAEDAVKPVWELGSSQIDQAGVKGELKLVDGVVKLDGTNSFDVPASLLGDQKRFTLEFSFKRGQGSASKDRLDVFSNFDAKEKAGIVLNYCPPDYNAINVAVNGNPTFEYRGFLSDKPSKVSIVVVDGQMSLFRDGLLMGMAGMPLKPSSAPLTFGQVKAKDAPTVPYELSGLKIYADAVFPSGFDQSAERMKTYSGEGYTMLRVDAKDSKLPRVLVVGDSISMGYRGTISERLKGKAYVDYWTNGWAILSGEKGVKGALSNGPYDVVTFNFGLHWWTHADRYVSDEKFVKDMNMILDWFQKASPQSKFVWIRTTPWRTTPKTGRPELDPKNNAMIIKVNGMADELMAKRGIPEVDAYSLCAGSMDTVPDGYQDYVHWNHDVSVKLGNLIADEIEKQLKKEGDRK